MSENENKPIKWNPVGNSEATRFRKGLSGNPGGRPKGVLSRAYRKALREKLEDGKPRVHKFVNKMLERAETDQSPEFARMVHEYTDGKLATPKEEPANVNQQQIFVVPSWSSALEASKPDSED